MGSAVSYRVLSGIAGLCGAWEREKRKSLTLCDWIEGCRKQQRGTMMVPKWIELWALSIDDCLCWWSCNGGDSEWLGQREMGMGLNCWFLKVQVDWWQPERLMSIWGCRKLSVCGCYFLIESLRTQGGLSNCLGACSWWLNCECEYLQMIGSEAVRKRIRDCLQVWFVNRKQQVRSTGEEKKSRERNGAELLWSVEKRAEDGGLDSFWENWRRRAWLQLWITERGIKIKGEVRCFCEFAVKELRGSYRGIG